MTGSFIVRPRRNSDDAELAEIFRRSIRETASRHYRPSQVEAWSRFADDGITWSQRLQSRQVWVAEDAGLIAGFIQFEPPDHIDLTYVHPDRQRQGVATALLAQVEETARNNGCRVLHVEASIASRPFFAARGFETVAPQIVSAGGQEFLNYRMQKWLR